MRSLAPIPRRLWRAIEVCLPGALLAAALLIPALPARAQDVAEAARKAKAQKSKDQKPAAPHVYTEDDLKKDHILTPGDQARADLKKKNSPAAPADQQQASDANKNSANESLGEIARRFRREKTEREAQEALKKQPTDFPMNLPAEEFASPKPIAPLRPLEKEIRPPVFRNGPAIRPKFAQPVQPMKPEILPGPKSRPAVDERAAVRKVSPFERRPLLEPNLPERKAGVPVAPKVSRPRPPAKFSLFPRVAPGPSYPAPKTVSVESPNTKRIVVKQGDSWWKISKRYLGRGARWRELADLNSQPSNPDLLVLGSELVVPVSTSAKPGEPELQKSSVTLFTVRRGDTLWSIARVHLGSGLAWTCLAEANGQLLDPNRIFPGETLSVPANCSARRDPVIYR